MFIFLGANQRFYSDKGWVKGYRTFSFQDYYNEDHDSFKSIVVLNDEILSPGAGFKKHPTEGVEVVTYIVEGSLEHWDDVSKTKTLLGKGDIQLLSTGKGVMHSEINPSGEQPLSFVQIWFNPEEHQKDPSYMKLSQEDLSKTNCLIPVFSKNKEALHPITQDLDFYFSNLEKNQIIDYSFENGRGILIFVLEGALSVNETKVKDRDCIRTSKNFPLRIEAEENTKFFLIDLI